MPRILYTAESIAAAEVMVCTTSMTITEISRQTGINRNTLSLRIKRGDWVRPQLDASVEAGAPPRLVRAWAVVDRQLRDVEKRLRGGYQDPAAQERDVKLVAVLVRLIREITALQANAGRAPEAPDDPHAPSLPEGRDELARRLVAVFQDGDPAALHE